jgi:pyruvate/2-oxoglutarate/acetoin dehydrogenase E1 component
VDVEGVDVRRLVPLDKKTIVESVKKTRTLWLFTRLARLGVLVLRFPQC